MRRAIVILIVAAIASQAFAAKQVTVEQLERMLTASRAKPDAELAQQLSDLQLSERLSSARLKQLQDDLPGEKSRQALTALADNSSFLAPPAAEIPGAPTPDFAEQKRIMGMVVAYVGKSIPQLPNFIATRKTIRFEDTPLVQRFGFAGFRPYEPLHFIDRTNATVLYRDGRELVNGDPATDRKSRPMSKGLTTWGVFGPILGTVLVDAAQSKIFWAHWEQGSSGPQAVFSYSVPKEKSHYEVNYCCVAEEAATPSANMHTFQKVVGYHGEFTVDPATGTILRITVEAELKPPDPIVKAAIMVEYGPVEIGGKTYTCPVRSVSSTREQVVQLDPVYKMPQARETQPIMNSLSDVAFEDYHVFRSESRVLAGNDAGTAGPEPSAGAATSTPTNAAASTSESQNPAGNPPSLSQAVAAPAESDAAAAVNGPAIAKVEEAPPEISASVANGIPDSAPNPASAAAASGFTLRSTSRLVDLSLVAFDKKGHPITDLKREDFTVYDNGVAQKIRFFSQATETGPNNSASSASSAAREAGPLTFSNRPAVGTGSALHGAAHETTVLLIDSSSLAWADFAGAREEMLRFLKTVPADEPVGLYVFKSYGFQIMMEPTVDHPSLAAVLSKWMPAAQDLSRAQEEEQRNRQHFDWVHSASDLAYVNGNDGTDPSAFYSGLGQATAAGASVDPQLRKMGSNPQRDALFNLQVVARHLAVIQGHKSLVWISSDNALADWNSQSAGREDKGSNFVDPIAIHAREALNEAHISIYPLDASQLEGGAITADLENRLIQARNPPKPGDPPPPPPNPTGRYAAQMHQDTHPIQGTFRELAEATGGRALRRAGDIAAELNGIVEDGRAAYQLSFSPDGPADDKYHNITVKVAGRKDVTLRYRTGYLYSREPQSMRDRFGQAIWQPRDAGEIGLSAEPRKTETCCMLKLNIAATDLDLKEQSGLWTDKLDIFLVELDQATAKARISGQTLGLRLKPGTYQRVLRDGITFEQQVEFKPRDGSVRVLVVDENSGRIGSVTMLAAAVKSKN